MVQQTGQNHIDIYLKCCRHICQSKRHYKILKISVADPEYCLPLIAIVYIYIIVNILEIKLSENFGSYQPVKGLINKGKRVSILYRDFIKSTIIDIKSKASILLRNEENRGSNGAYTGPDPMLADYILQVQIQHLQLDF